MGIVKIERVENGFILELDNTKTVYLTLDELFERLLLHYEGKSKVFYHEAYGNVIIERDRQEE